MKIYVNNHDLGFFTTVPITVQRFWPANKYMNIDKELLWCNHAGAEEYEGEDFFGVVYSTLKCDKCDAYRPQNSDMWEDSPSEGVHYDD